jgi:AcrR family transcriptional regulator
MASAAPTRTAPLQPADWIRAAFQRLSSDGLEAVRIEVLARDLGVSKGSFYWHFQDREDLLRKMLEQWETEEAEWLAAAISGVHSPAARWARLVNRSAHPQKLRFEASLRAWARKDVSVAARVADLERKRMQYISSVLQDTGFSPHAAESWAEMLFLIYLGWLDRTTRDSEFHEQNRDLGDFLSEMVLAASARKISSNQ